MRRLSQRDSISKAALASRRVGLFAAVGAGMSVAVARLNPSAEPNTELVAFGASLVVEILALLLAAAAMVEIWNSGRRGISDALFGAALSLAVLAYPAYLTLQTLRFPLLDQVTTDYKSPPPFLISTRARDARFQWTPSAPGPEDEAAAHAAYPGLKTLSVDLEPDQAYRMSLRVIKDLGWRVTDSIPPSPRGDAQALIEASQRSLFLGFPAAVVIRIHTIAGKTEIDLRSASHMLRHDFGANALRIQRFSDAVRASLEDK